MKNALITFTAILFSTICFYSCSEESSHVILKDISEFRIDNSALHDSELVEVLFASKSLFPTDEVDYYVQAVVVSSESGDTVNVLSVGIIEIADTNRNVVYVSPESEMGRVIQNTNTLNGKKAKDLKSKTFSKVYTDTKYIPINTSNFPSIVGLLGKQKVPAPID